MSGCDGSGLTSRGESWLNEGMFTTQSNRSIEDARNYLRDHSLIMDDHIANMRSDEAVAQANARIEVR